MLKDNNMLFYKYILMEKKKNENKINWISIL